MKRVKILETTLRDGSYAINFSFTIKDTALICRELEAAGLEFIEIGHGVGLNASNCGYGQAAQTDEEYLEAAASVLSKAKFGMFCIPGIARLEDIDMAAQYKMGFIRIGTNVTEVASSQPFIQRAKQHGMFVCANFMKSYAMAPLEFAKMVKLSESFGADMVYVVDSAGGMFPDDIKSYYQAIREVSNVPLGFHGHDNLAFAVYNSIYAAEQGFEIVDSSLQGLGRSSGNAATENLIAALMKKKYCLDIDFFKILAIGQKYIKPLITSKGKGALDIVAGFSEFHSSYMCYINKFAAQYEIDPARLMIEVSNVDKINVTEKMVERVAAHIAEEKPRDLY
ncbi:MAG: 4-hydroxy-2-oxovalerate aldolase [Candidatus Babeliales bacterium]|jgi:4-hydroxy-2-oxovalerate aldolase